MNSDINYNKPNLALAESIDYEDGILWEGMYLAIKDIAEWIGVPVPYMSTKQDAFNLYVEVKKELARLRAVEQHVHDADCLLAASWHDYCAYMDDVKSTVRGARTLRMQAWEVNNGRTSEVLQILQRL